ncbi:hypothetical protein [Kribbella shirazensis]|uniref:Secreted protein n=1 Tax=Kribbella shirazensis TaxID=1105143 RepID=A0A7X5V9N3_9ACTN|nr:hypothetical protein [Kribbella shirazensis]NIK56512.1 hypothetical protein [Kribbella shirazensis]
MNKIARRTGGGLLATAAIIAMASPSAYADSWQTFDTDNIGRSVDSGRGYTTGYFRWQKLVDEGPNLQEDYRADFDVRLNVAGAPNSCAWLRIITYEKGTATGAEVSLSKRFPSAGDTPYGYYGICGGADGKGYRNISGSDELWSGMAGHKFVRADIRVCYTRSYVPPGDNCYAFTIHPGD